METMLDVVVVGPAAVMVALGLVRGIFLVPAAWREEAPMVVARRRLVLVHDSAREKLLRSPHARRRAAGPRIRLVYNGG